MHLLFRFIVLCLYICMVRSFEDTTNYKLFGPKMCKELCKSIEHCKLPRYDEHNFVCYPLMDSTEPANKNQRYTRTIKSRLKGLVTVAEVVPHKQDQTTAPITVSSAGYLVVTFKKVTNMRRFYHLSTLGQHITELKWKKGELLTRHFAYDSGKLLWIDKKNCLIVAKIFFKTITPEIRISYQGPRDIYMLEVDMGNQILFVKAKFTNVLHTAIINKEELIKWKTVGTVRRFEIDRIRRHIYKHVGKKLTRMGYNGDILNTFTVNYRNEPFSLDCQAQLTVYYRCSNNIIVKYEITGSAVKHEELVIKNMRCFKVWKYGQVVYVYDVHRGLVDVKDNTLGQRLTELRHVSNVYSL